jgi:hypothetical protein
MRKGSMLLALAAALVLIVVTASMAWAGRWDDHDGPGATCRQVTNGWVQPTTQASGAARFTGARTGQAPCEETRVHEQAAVGRTDCAVRAGDHNTRSHNAPTGTRPATTSARSSSHPARDHDHQRAECRDGHCLDDRD